MIGQAIPTGLAALPPGPELAAALAGVDLGTVPNDDVVDVLVALSRQLAHDQARLFEAMVEVIRRRPFAGPAEVLRGDVPELYGADEVRAALSWTRRAAERETDLAYAVVAVLPLVHEALRAGEIDRGKAWVFAQHLCDLTAAQVEAICRAVLPVAGRLTTGQIAERLKRLVIELDPGYYERRYRKAVRDRKLIGHLAPDGSGVISASGLKAEEAAAAWEQVDAVAGACRRAGVAGTLDQVRADLAVGLLDGSLHHLTHAEIIDTLLARYADAGPDAGPDDVVAESGPTRSCAGSEDDPSPEPVDRDPGRDRGGDRGPSDDQDVPDAVDGTRTAERGRPAASAGSATSTHRNAGDRPDERRRPASARPGAGIEIRVALTTLLGLDDRPGEIPAWGPVPASSARRAVAGQRRAQWRWVVVDGAGHLVAEGITHRRPRGLTRSGAIGGVVEIQVCADALADLAVRPQVCGEWAGVVADIAERHRRDQAARVADLDAHPHDRFPRAALRRHVQVRDRTCTFVGCRTSARRADQDHTLDHSRGGSTVSDDLSPLCRHDHMLKTGGGWELWQPTPGRFVWRSPLGREYPVAPQPILPPPIEPVTRGPDPWHDEPADEHDGVPFLHPPRRGPPIRDGRHEPAEPRPLVDGEDPPPF